MDEIVNALTASDYVELIGIITSLITSIVAIVISVKTLMQNNKMIEESSRPYVTISKEVIDINFPKEYLVLKNYGTSGAEILDITCNVPIDTLISASALKRDPFSYLIGTFIAPNQSFCPIFSSKNLDEDVLIFTIKYKTEDKVYTTVSKIKVQQDHGISYSKSLINGKELELIAKTLQEMIIQNL